MKKLGFTLALSLLAFLPSHLDCSAKQANPQVQNFAKRNKFSKEEDQRLTEIVTMLGDKDWTAISSLMKTRNERQCRERWRNYLSPHISYSKFTPEEDKFILEKSVELNFKWCQVAKLMINRSSTQIKNRYHTLLYRDLKKSRINPASRTDTKFTQCSLDFVPIYNSIFQMVLPHITPVPPVPATPLPQPQITPVVPKPSIQLPQNPIPPAPVHEVREIPYQEVPAEEVPCNPVSLDELEPRPWELATEENFEPLPIPDIEIPKDLEKELLKEFFGDFSSLFDNSSD